MVPLRKKNEVDEVNVDDVTVTRSSVRFIENE